MNPCKDRYNVQSVQPWKRIFEIEPSPALVPSTMFPPWSPINITAESQDQRVVLMQHTNNSDIRQSQYAPQEQGQSTLRSLFHAFRADQYAILEKTLEDSGMNMPNIHQLKTLSLEMGISQRKLRAWFKQQIQEKTQKHSNVVGRQEVFQVKSKPFRWHGTRRQKSILNSPDLDILDPSVAQDRSKRFRAATREIQSKIQEASIITKSWDQEQSPILRARSPETPPSSKDQIMFPALLASP